MFASCFLVLGVVLSIVSLSHSIAIGDVLLLSAEMDSYIVVSLIATGYAFAIRAVLGLAMASLHRLRGEWLRRRT